MLQVGDGTHPGFKSGSQEWFQYVFRTVRKRWGDRVGNVGDVLHG